MEARVARAAGTISYVDGVLASREAVCGECSNEELRPREIAGCENRGVSENCAGPSITKASLPEISSRTNLSISACSYLRFSSHAYVGERPGGT
jgi:hypothetical protein